jgi:hypothetical protein
MADQDIKAQIGALSREQLEAIAWAAQVALSRYRDYEDQPGFPPGTCAWAMGRDLGNAFAEAGVEVPSFGEKVAAPAAGRDGREEGE